MSEAANGVMTGAISFNFALAIFLGVSLKHLWMLMSSLQIIVNIPMFNIILPGNLLVVTSTLVDISNFNLIPLEPIKEKVFYGLGFYQNTTSNVMFKVMDIF